MSLRSKVDIAAKKLAGRVKEATGRATRDERLETEGKRDQVKADLRQAAEKVKDAFRRR